MRGKKKQSLPEISNNFGAEKSDPNQIKSPSTPKVQHQTKIDEFKNKNNSNTDGNQWVVYDNKYPASIVCTKVKGSDIIFCLQTLGGKIFSTDYSKISPFTADFIFNPENLDLGEIFSKNEGDQEVQTLTSLENELEVAPIDSTSPNLLIQRMVARDKAKELGYPVNPES